VIGIHAGADATEVVYGQSTRNWANAELIGQTMGNDMPSLDRKLSIARALFSCHPEPAGLGELDL
jgi:hypothetical protein